MCAAAVGAREASWSQQGFAAEWILLPLSLRCLKPTAVGAAAAASRAAAAPNAAVAAAAATAAAAARSGFRRAGCPSCSWRTHAADAAAAAAAKVEGSKTACLYASFAHTKE